MTASGEFGVSMAFKVGKRVVAESESIGRDPAQVSLRRCCEAIPRPRYRIRWDDGHESMYTPASGALRANNGKKPQRAAARKR